MALIRTLLDNDRKRPVPILRPGLRDLYDGDLQFPASPIERPFVFANFVSTLDGVVSYEIQGRADGSTISGFDPGDRFIMGLLRASADAILVGARTVQDSSPQSLWIPEYTYPDAKDLYDEYRINTLHRPKYPMLVVVSGSGNLELERAIFQTREVQTLVFTTLTGADVLAKAGATKLPTVRIHALNSGSGSLDPRAVVRLLREQYEVTTLLHEGGPSLFGQFLAAGIIDEFFLTLSPQIAGRDSRTARPSLVEGTTFVPASAPWFQVLSVKQNADHLYLRFQCKGINTSIP